MEVAENVISEKPCSVHVGVLKNAERDALKREIQPNALATSPLHSDCTEAWRESSY